MKETASVKMFGEEIGIVSTDESDGFCSFEYRNGFFDGLVDPSPIVMSHKANGIFSFPNLSKATYRGLPGMLSDSLPDKFGNAVIDSWLKANGRKAYSLSPIERLLCLGSCGMGALEYEPSSIDELERSQSVSIGELVVLAQEATNSAMDSKSGIGNDDKIDSESVMEILRTCSFAGGARPKAVVATNNEGQVLSGQAAVPAGYEHWLIKFDGVSDIELGAPQGYGRIEYAYSLMAKAAGLIVPESRLLEEGGRAHFLIKRFDREGGRKLHMQSLCGLAHMDFNEPGAYGYEDAVSVIRRLGLGEDAVLQQFKRAAFNIVARNQDDHTKNVSFLMDEHGLWSLSPTYDATFSCNPKGKWTNRHQMSLNEKREGFERADLVEFGRRASIPNPEEAIDEVLEAASQWPQFAKQAGVDEERTIFIASSMRLSELSKKTAKLDVRRLP